MHFPKYTCKVRDSGKVEVKEGSGFRAAGSKGLGFKGFQVVGVLEVISSIAVHMLLAGCGEGDGAAVVHGGDGRGDGDGDDDKNDEADGDDDDDDGGDEDDGDDHGEDDDDDDDDDEILPMHAPRLWRWIPKATRIGKPRRGNTTPFGSPAADDGTLLSLQDSGDMDPKALNPEP